MIGQHLSRWALRGLAVAAIGLAVSTSASAAATLTIVNVNAAGVGFNDPTPVAPLSSNPGTTIGQQRLYAFTFAANVWGATLTSSVPIIVRAQFTALTCTSTGAVLGSAGATQAFSDFAGALIPGVLYSFAEANKLSGVDQDPGQPQINANFNSNLGNTGCLDGTFFYLGTDNNHGANIDLVAVLLHEFGHGLGFQTYTNGLTGAFNAGVPAVWDVYLKDNDLNLTWINMTAAQRAASALKINKLVWNGPGVTAASASVLGGTPELAVTSPSSVARSYAIGTASFGPALNATGVSGGIGQVVDQINGTGLACTTLSAANVAAVRGKIALVDRGVCGFVVKAAVVQAAGAIGMIVADNAAGAPAGLGGSDPTITIPSVRISQADGAALKAANTTRSRNATALAGKLDTSIALGISGADAQGHVLMYSPNPYQSGSSVSHYDTTAFPNLLMEPAINGDLSHSVTLPQDLTFRLLQDIGW